MPLMFDPINHRRHPRLGLTAPYTHVRARRPGDRRFTFSGHVYDISRTGMRLELDEGLDRGTELAVRVQLPGRFSSSFEASVLVVRQHDEDDAVGPVRMGVIFDQFASSEDEQRLLDYLRSAGLEPPESSPGTALAA